MHGIKSLPNWFMEVTNNPPFSSWGKQSFEKSVEGKVSGSSKKGFQQKGIERLGVSGAD